MLTRRRALLGGAAITGTAALAGAAWAVEQAGASPSPSPAPTGNGRAAAAVGDETVPASGPHQAGVTTAAQAAASFLAFDLSVTDRDRVVGLLRILTDDIRRMTSGRAALGDTAPALATSPARLTVTVGFGPGFFAATGTTDRQPAGLSGVPAFPGIDRLETAWSGGDLLLKIAADDPMVVAHVQRMLVKDTRPFATLRWCQRGFLHARGAAPDGATGRNLMGQLDGTVNPITDEEFDAVVWAGGDDWFAGGTTAVIRRIRMDLDAWDQLDPAAMGQVIGRRLADGAPLSGGHEDDEPDFSARDALGLVAIPDFAHIRVARGDGPARQILRRPYNFDVSAAADGTPDVGQIFCSFQADVAAQFVPIQQRLAAGDLFNRWTTPIGSAVFAIPPGFGPDGWIGQGLFA